MAIFFDIDARIDDAINKIKQVASSVDTITEATENASKIIESALSDAIPADAFKEGLDTLAQGIDDAKSEIETLSASLGDLDGEEFSAASDRIEELNSQLQVAEATYAGVDSAFQSFMGNVNSGTGSVEKHNSAFMKMLGGEEQYKAILSMLPAPLASVVSGIESMTAASWSFIATPVGAILGAIVLALAALYQWFTSTSEGEMELAKVTGYFSGVLDVLKTVVVEVGKRIYEAFTDPKKAVEDLWKAIKEHLLNRIKGMGNIFKTLGEMIGAVFSGDFDSEKWSRMGKDLSNACLQASTGVDNLIGKYKQFTNQLETTANAEAKLSVKEKQLARDRSAWQVEEQKIDNQIEELRNSNTSGGNKKENQAKAQELVNKKYEKRLDFAKRELAIVQQRNKLSPSNDADIDRENKAKAEVLKIEQERTREMRRFNAQAYSSNRSGGSSKSGRSGGSSQQIDPAKAAEQEYNLQKQAERNRIKRELETEQAILDQREDGYQKRLDQIALNYKKEQEAIRQEEENLREENYQQAKKTWEASNKTAFTGKRGDSAYGLTAEQEEYIKGRNDRNLYIQQKALDQEKEAQRKAFIEYLEQYGSYQDQKLAITEKYDKLIADANREGLTGKAMSYQKEKEQSIASIDFEELKEGLNWELIFGDLENQSRKSLTQVRDDLRKFANSTDFKKAGETDKKAISEAIDNLNNAISDKSPLFANIANAVKSRKQALEDLTQAEIELREAELSYQIVMENGSEDQQREAREKLQKARSNRNSKQNNLQNAEGQLAKASNDAANSVMNVVSALGDLGESSDSISPAKVGQLISTIMTSIGGQGSGLSKAGTFIGTAFALDEQVAKVGIENFTKNIMQQIGTSFLHSWNWGDWMGIRSNIEDCQKTIDEANSKNQILAQSLNKLNDTIQKSDLSKLNGVYENAKELTTEQMKNASKALVTEASKHDTNRSSLNYSVNDNTGFQLALKKVSSILDKNVMTSQQFLSLTAQELAKIRDADNGKTLNAILQEYRDEGGKGGRSSDLPQQILDYISTYENVFTDLEDTINEALTGITFDSLENDFKSTLKDMESDTDTFGDKLEETLRNAVINGISKDHQEQLENWYADFAKAMESGLTNAEASALRTRYEQITNEAVAERDLALEKLGLNDSSSISASQRSVASMSEETASELNGRFTALQISGQTIAEGVTNSIIELRNIGSSVMQANTLLSEINMSVIACNGTLNSIYNSNESGFRKMVEAINNVQSSINSKL